MFNFSVILFIDVMKCSFGNLEIVFRHETNLRNMIKTILEVKKLLVVQETATMFCSKSVDPSSEQIF